jgi:hypothetical protein
MPSTTPAWGSRLPTSELNMCYIEGSKSMRNVQLGAAHRLLATVFAAAAFVQANLEGVTGTQPSAIAISD